MIWPFYGNPPIATWPQLILLSLAATSAGRPAAGIETRDLDVGVAAHAFDHLGGIANQAPAAAASGSTILYASGFGWMYNGLRPPDQMKSAADATASYLRQARIDGICLAFGYVCGTSIVDLAHFDRNWSPDFRARFSSSQDTWLQQDREGKSLASWYGGDYRPACMNNPDWRSYEKFVVGLQLEAGFDGIFFDNPTVHPQGCFCQHCMRKFATFLAGHGKFQLPGDASLSELRKLAVERPDEFRRFRVTIAADFLADMRTFARTIKPHALVTCNNSLNSPDALFLQCRTYAYDIHELSNVEDLVVVEDMVSLPRTLANGKVIEYGPVYEVLRSISHGKPVVAITLAEGDYHTPPDLTRLAMAEAAAHGSSYLLWPTWPQEVRQKMISSVRPETDLLRQRADLLKDARQRTDVALFLPFRQWVATAECRPMQLARVLAAANVPFQVVCEDELAGVLDPKTTPVLLVESPSVLLEAEKGLVEKFRTGGGQVVGSDNADWFGQLRKMVQRPSVRVQGPATVRVTVRDQPGRTIVHLLNLDVRRRSSFEDGVTPAANVALELRIPFAPVHSVEAISADPEATHGPISYTSTADPQGTLLRMVIARTVLSTMLLIR